jgi:hypothetical protein
MAVSDKVSFRIPADLADWFGQQPGKQSEVIVRALRALRDGIPQASIDHGIVRTADLTMPAPPIAAGSQSRFAGGQVDVSLRIPQAVMACDRLAKLDPGARVRLIEDEIGERFLYRKVRRVE